MCACVCVWPCHATQCTNHLHLYICPYICPYRHEFQSRAIPSETTNHLHLYVCHSRTTYICTSPITWPCNSVHQSPTSTHLPFTNHLHLCICHSRITYFCTFAITCRATQCTNHLHLYICHSWITYGVATISRLLKMLGLFCNRAL